MTSNEESSEEMYICSVCNIILQTEHEEWICTACYLSDSYAYKYAIPKDTENND
jgi:rubrerythrin